MAQWLNWGDGHSGSPNSISGTINTYATCTGTATQSVLTTTLSASAGDQILIHQTQGTGAGLWELCEVLSDAGATLNLKTALVNSYGTGAQAVLIPQYTGGNISGAVTGTAWNGSVGGIIALMSNGDLTVSGSITAPAGFRGGAGRAGDDSIVGTSGEGNTGVGSVTVNANTQGGGGANRSGGVGGAGGGGYGAAGSNGNPTNASNGRGGGEAGIATNVSLFLGGGGGGSAEGTSGTHLYTGGAGGGIVLIIAKNLTVTGTILSTGGTAGGTTAYEVMGAGGGAGGGVLIKTQVAVLGTNLITAAAGTGGQGGSSNKTGGTGGVGRIRCDYFTSVSGSTTPTLSSAQDLTLNLPSSNFFAFF